MSIHSRSEHQRTCSNKGPEDGDDEGGSQGGPLGQFDKAGDDGGKHEEEAEARHPEVTQRAVHEHAGTLQCGLELDRGAANGVHSAPQGLHICPPEVHSNDPRGVCSV